jgi:outer membrane immunogenic protein
MTTKTIRYGVAIAALLMAPLAANAADLPRPYKAPVYTPVAPAYASWSGAYVGVNVGYGFGKADVTAPGVSASVSPKGMLAGVTLGYNYQTGVWVWGAEGDWDWSNMKADATCGAITCSGKASWIGTARARIGYAGWNNWLPYFTGGLGMGNIKVSTPLGESSSTRMGWTAGAGVEYAMWSNWSVKAEYLYVDLGKFDCGAACGGVGAADVSFKTNIVRAGLNYRF